MSHSCLFRADCWIQILVGLDSSHSSSLQFRVLVFPPVQPPFHTLTVEWTPQQGTKRHTAGHIFPNVIPSTFLALVVEAAMTRPYSLTLEAQMRKAPDISCSVYLLLTTQSGPASGVCDVWLFRPLHTEGLTDRLMLCWNSEWFETLIFSFGIGQHKWVTSSEDSAQAPLSSETLRAPDSLLRLPGRTSLPVLPWWTDPGGRRLFLNGTEAQCPLSICHLRAKEQL